MSWEALAAFMATRDKATVERERFPSLDEVRRERPQMHEREARRQELAIHRMVAEQQAGERRRAELLKELQLAKQARYEEKKRLRQFTQRQIENYLRKVA